jgi:hypothetical protein
MEEVNFNYNGINTIIQCLKDDYIKDICIKFTSKIQIDLNNLIFVYGGELLNIELKYNEIIKNKERMNILVYDKNSTYINKNERIIKSKDIICLKCGEICRIKIINYKIKINECKNNHEYNNILLNEFDNTQNINECKIICNNCNNNKSKTYNNKFYICGECNINLCPICKSKHNKEHKIIDYDNKNYICNKHNELYISYCEKCKNNLCMQCEIEHNNSHKII